MIKYKTLFSLFILSLFLHPCLASESSSAFGEPIKGEGYNISRSTVNRQILFGSFFDDRIIISNSMSSKLDIKIDVSEELKDLIRFESREHSILPKEKGKIDFRIKGDEYGQHTGTIDIGGDIKEKIDVNLSVVDEIKDPLYLIDTHLDKTSFNSLEKLKFVLSVDKLMQSYDENMNITYYYLDSENESFYLDQDLFNNSDHSFRVSKSFDFPKEASFGDGTVITKIDYGRDKKTVRSYLFLHQHFLLIKIFGLIPMWLLLIILFIGGMIALTIYIIKRRIAAKKKYRMELAANTLPKPNKSYLNLGKVAETKIPAYLEPERMKTHTIVAGATGGGKSISAQVIVEEVLKQNVAVVVFDPTAQWSGMLRKCEDKKMFKYYPKFKMKPTEAKSFPGSIRMVTDAREIIDINKHVNPGQIQIFALNKLDPKDMDIFVANVIREIFKSDPKEVPELKLLIVFDEVHRLLSKFGGSGEGFLQIERACREFRKWGMGVMLVSQVLNDFVGEIKANINTEVQMRTRAEGDLNRINTKYGEEFLQSLVKASVGVGMFVNQNYNRGKPYFINFRPILHSTRRLSDEELEKYNNYNEKADQMSFEISELEKMKVDVFDLKMELKLVKDKIMTGNFSVVDIYLQGLEPRLKKQWEKLGKKPPKMQKKLADLEEIKKSIEEAKKAREKYEKKNEKKGEEKKEEEEDITKKLLKPVTFDNGMMISNVDELLSVLPEMDTDIFSAALKKNEFVNFTKQADESLSKKLQGKKKKEEVEKIIKEWIENNKKKTEDEKKDDKKEGEEGEENKESEESDEKEE